MVRGSRSGATTQQRRNRSGFKLKSAGLLRRLGVHSMVCGAIDYFVSMEIRVGDQPKRINIARVTLFRPHPEGDIKLPTFSMDDFYNVRFLPATSSHIGSLQVFVQSPENVLLHLSLRAEHSHLYT